MNNFSYKHIPNRTWDIHVLTQTHYFLQLKCNWSSCVFTSPSVKPASRARATRFFPHPLQNLDSLPEQREKPQHFEAVWHIAHFHKSVYSLAMCQMPHVCWWGSSKQPAKDGICQPHVTLTRKEAEWYLKGFTENRWWIDSTDFCLAAETMPSAVETTALHCVFHFDFWTIFSKWALMFLLQFIKSSGGFLPNWGSNCVCFSAPALLCSAVTWDHTPRPPGPDPCLPQTSTNCKQEIHARFMF